MTPRPDHGETSYCGSGRLVGRKALITGGDSGIGRAAAITFAREGADVGINYLPVEESDARDVVELIQAAGRKALAIPGDIRDERFCNQLVDDAVRGLGGIDVLVHVAARQQACESIAELTTEYFDWTVKTILYALFWITKAALPQLGTETPYGRPGQPVEIAPVYVMLAAAESSYASGQVIGDSGGQGAP